MTATTAEPLTDVLPDRKSGRHTVHFYPGLLPGCGVVEVEGKRDRCRYALVETPTDWPNGRAFRFEKVPGEPGTDPTEEAYSVFCSGDEREGRCDCRGFARHRHCKHHDAAATLIGNGWL